MGSQVQQVLQEKRGLLVQLVLKEIKDQRETKDQLATPVQPALLVQQEQPENQD